MRVGAARAAMVRRNFIFVFVLWFGASDLRGGEILFLFFRVVEQCRLLIATKRWFCARCLFSWFGWDAMGHKGECVSMYNECDEEQGAYVITDPCSVNKDGGEHKRKTIFFNTRMYVTAREERRKREQKKFKRKWVPGGIWP